MQTKQKGGKKGSKAAAEPKVAQKAAEEVPKDFFMATLGPQKRNKVKKMKIIAEMEVKGGELNADQLEKIAKKNELKDEIDKLDYYIDLYEKTHPDWNKPVEEAKVEEPVAVAPSEDVINQHVVNAFTKFAQMLTLRQIVDHIEISEDEQSHLTSTMAPYHTLVQDNETLEGGDKQAAFAQAMVAAVNDQALQDMCGKCFSEEQLSKTRLRIASAKEVVPAQTQVEEAKVEEVAEPVEEIVEAAAPADNPAPTEEPAAENVEAKDAVDAPAEEQGEPGTENATEQPASTEQVQEEQKQPGEQPVAEESKEKKPRHEGERGDGKNRGRYNNDRGGRRGDNRHHRGGRGGKSFGEQVDEDGFQTQADRQQRFRGGQRGGRGGERGGRGNYRGNNQYGDRDQNNEFRKGGGRGARGGERKPSDRPQTATATAAPVTGEDNNKGTMEGKQE